MSGEDWERAIEPSPFIINTPASAFERYVYAFTYTYVLCIYIYLYVYTHIYVYIYICLGPGGEQIS
jgi:hypothetical protein